MIEDKVSQKMGHLRSSEGGQKDWKQDAVGWVLLQIFSICIRYSLHCNLIQDMAGEVPFQELSAYWKIFSIQNPKFLHHNILLSIKIMGLKF